MPSSPSSVWGVVLSSTFEDAEKRFGLRQGALMDASHGRVAAIVRDFA